ncbi:YncE family protein [Planctomycetota bacterium]
MNSHFRNHRFDSSPWILCAITLVVFAISDARAEELNICYSFTRGSQGGLVMATIDSETGKVLHQKIKYESGHCAAPKKVRPVGDGKTFIVTHDDEKRPFVFVIDTQDPQLNRLIELPGMPDEVRIAGTQAIVTCSKDFVVTIDIASRRILGMWDVSDYLNPPGNHPQGILITPENTHAIISFQKDSPSGKKLGGRLAMFALPGMDLVSDVVLGRDYDGWELKNKIRKTGPGLELVFLDEENDTILASADHYGAVALMRWSEFQTGHLKKLEYRSTAVDESWGHSFPDRGILVKLGNKSYCLICNAGEDGGSVIVDLQTWNVVHRMQTHFGLEKPVYVPELKRAFSTCPGKHKTRSRGKIEKTYKPHPSLTVFEFDDAEPAKSTVRTIPQAENVFQMGVLRRDGKTPLFVLTSGGDQANRIVVFDPATETILDNVSSIGVAVQFEKN